LARDAGPLAAIDLGSNSFRLEIANCQAGRYRRVEYLKETVRLGGGLDENSRLVGPAVDRGLSCLARFRTRLAALPARHIRAVATQTLREASNRDEFLKAASLALGQPIEVISGREEARLTFNGVAALQPADTRRLVIDIGGRSTEMILGQGRQISCAESYGVGSVSLSRRYFADGRYSAAAFAAAQVAAAAEFEEARELFTPSMWSQALGSSGTASAVSKVLAAHGQTDGAITADGLRWCAQACLQAGTVDKLALRSLAPDRAPIFGGGIAILGALLDLFGIDALRPAKGALRQGVIVDLAERLLAEQETDHHDLRDDSVRAMQLRFGVDHAQARRVRSTALAIHAGLAGSASVEQVRELGWVADLHEIGMAVSHHDHHRHSAYLLAHVDAPGFSQSQQRLLARLVLGQRGGLSKVQELWADTARLQQLLALRLAVLLCHPRMDAPEGLVVQLTGKPSGYTLTLLWPAGWTTELPRMAYLLEQEAAAWSKIDDMRVGAGALSAQPVV
jgi:exopolyphosphatase/guanosine-5'-triphosphate,3'-diphosphate pyrophosphatase